MQADIHLLSYLAQFFLEWEMFQTKVVEKIETHILYSVTFSRKPCRLWDNVGKYCRTEQATDDNMTRAHCILDNASYGHTHTHTHSEYVILIPFALQQWLRERTSMLLYTYIACLFPFGFHFMLLAA